MILSCYSVTDYSVLFLPLIRTEEVRTNEDKATAGGIPSISNHWLCIIHVVYSLYHDRMFLIVHRHNALREKKGNQVKRMKYLTTLHKLHSTKINEWTDGRSILRYYSSMLTAVGIITKTLQYSDNISAIL